MAAPATEHSDSQAGAIYRSLARVLPAKLAAGVTGELAILGSAFSGLFSSLRTKRASLLPSFTYVNTGPLRYLWLIVLIGAVPETWLLHLLLPRHRVIELILLVIVLWGFLWLIGYYHAMRDHPHTIEGECATFRFGFRRSCTVHWLLSRP